MGVNDSLLRAMLYSASLGRHVTSTTDFHSENVETSRV